MGKNKDIDKDEIQEKSFVAYIVKGNRQVIKREVVASKRFRVQDDTYIVKDECIFYKNIEGVLRSVSYYREGNPNPYNFKDINKGLSETDENNELNEFYEKDFYNILAKIKPFSKVVYVLIISIFVMGLNLAFLISMILKELVF
ncbi:MAG: hypothetical protein BV457_01595 [Thermoplasmata archaeon M9B1D]|nr:MAG: hypothetical protein BV457_01595 [Thermoplasmata archaeon M9B1D]